MEKTILLIVICLFIGRVSIAQKVSEDKVPSAVKSEFVKFFPKATKTQWEIEKEVYEVTFINNGVETSASYDKTGKLIETEFELTEKELPEAVKTSITKNFVGYTIKEISRLEKPEQKAIYEVELIKDKNTIEVQFSRAGDVLNKK